MTISYEVMLKLILHLYFISFTFASDCTSSPSNDGVCSIESTIPPRYILYDVNPYEGFNLRRDVYMRLAVFVKNLNRDQDGIKWHLVLPPWSDLPHWRSMEVGPQRNIPWGVFFNLQSLRKFAPVMEMYEFLEDHSKETIDHVIILQHFKDLFSENFTWEDKWSVEECERLIDLLPEDDDTYEWSVLGFRDILVKNITCVSFQGPTSLLKDVLNSFQGRFILLEHAEIVLHDFYGGEDYWKCRKSMKFNQELYDIALSFRRTELGSNPTTEHVASRNGTYFEGDPYLCAHLRRRDYVLSRPKDVPSLEWAAVQIQEKLKRLDLHVAFIISDEMDHDLIRVFEELLPSYHVVAYIPPLDIKRKYKDGGVAIIEQIICSYARYFIGSYESTFSFRIQEERELLNFHPDTTFNRLCGNNQTKCKQPSRWLKFNKDLLQ